MDGVVVTSGAPEGTASGAAGIGRGPQPLHPRQIQAWRLGWGLAALAVTVTALVFEVVLAMADGVDLPWFPGLLTLICAVVGGTLAWRLPRLGYDAWRYELNDSTLELRRGLVVRSHSAIPYFRVQHIDITRSPFERALGLSQLVVRTAAATTDARLPGIAETEAELLRDVILARTGSGDAV
jgi:membrane protein YdbS with pleckstrin-like domain